MHSASEGASAGVQAYVLGFDVLMSVGGALLLPTLHGLLLTGTAALSALVTPAVELRSTRAETHRLLNVALVAD